jgi:hypothetical protein
VISKKSTNKIYLSINKYCKSYSKYKKGKANANTLKKTTLKQQKAPKRKRFRKIIKPALKDTLKQRDNFFCIKSQ